MLDFDYAALPSRIYFGLDASRGPRLLHAADAVGARSPLVVIAESDLGVGQATIETLGDRVAGIFSGIRPHVPTAVAEEARGVAARCNADSIVSIGGGSTTGTAKAIALSTNLPILAVPTTYAGSEVTPVWGLTEGERKVTGTNMRVLPRAVVYDPVLTTSLPPTLSVASGLNAMAHCAEALWSQKRNPITSLTAQEGIRAFATGLPRVKEEPEDLEARSSCLLGAWLAGSAFAASGSDIHHKICHVLGGAFDLPHAETHAVVLPYSTAVAIERVPGADAQIASAIGASGLSATPAIWAFERRLGVASSLQEVGLGEAQIPLAIELVAEALERLPVPVSRTAVEELIQDAFEGAEPRPKVSSR